MPVFIICPECRNLIGHYYEFVNQAIIAQNKHKLHNKNSSYDEFDPKKILLNGSILDPTENIFNALNIKNRCCRIRLLTYNDIDLSNSLG